MEDRIYRGIIKGTKNFTYGYFFRHADGTPAIFTPNDGSLVIEEGTQSQFVGIEDIKGTDIYEGDICLTKKLKGKCTKIEIKFHEAGFRRYEEGYDYRYSPTPICSNDISDFEIEVIGNIFQHPELIF